MFLALLLTGTQLLHSQQEYGTAFIEFKYGRQHFESDRGLSYTFHRFNPAVFLGSAHEHFNVDPFNYVEERLSFGHLHFYYPFSELLDVELITTYRSSSRESSNEFFHNSYSGLGDLLVGGTYQWYNSSFRTGVTGTQMRLGVSAILPTGRFEDFTSEGELEPQLQSGTGAIGVLAKHIVYKQFNNLSLKWLIQYQYNTDNKYGYRFGSSLFNEVKTRYTLSNLLFPIHLSLGAVYNHAESDIMNERRLFNPEEGGEDTGGQWLNLFAKVEVQFGKKVVFIETNHPLWQDLLGQQLKRGSNLNFGLRYEFGESSTFNAK